MSRANLLELFSSYQGEGIWVGVRQVFLRLGGCHLRCFYCDTPESWQRPAEWREEIRPMSGRFETRRNPAELEEILAAVERHAGGCHSVSITGGEPLLQTDFLEDLLPRLSLPVYLETSGTLSDRLARIAPHVDYLSLDFKPPSTPGANLDWGDFEACVALAAGRRAQVKVVVAADTPTPEEIRRAADILISKDPSIPLVFTPVTPVNPECLTANGDRLSRLLRSAAPLAPQIVPQIHTIAGWK